MEQRCTKKLELYYICHPCKKSLIFAKSKSFNLAIPEKYVCKKVFGKNVAKKIKSFILISKKASNLQKIIHIGNTANIFLQKGFCQKFCKSLQKFNLTSGSVASPKNHFGTQPILQKILHICQNLWWRKF